MKKALQRIGILAWWLTLPGLIVYLYGKPRTRVLIASGGKIVVVKGWLSNGKWILPGGGLHRAEEPLAGLLREAREETGLQLEPSDVQATFQEVYRYRGIVFPCHYFAVELPDQLPRTRQNCRLIICYNS
jgi:8-oxo-dGTP pyrophosphatase MutT (NUDIX family)